MIVTILLTQHRRGKLPIERDDFPSYNLHFKGIFHGITWDDPVPNPTTDSPPSAAHAKLRPAALRHTSQRGADTPLLGRAEPVLGGSKAAVSMQI